MLSAAASNLREDIEVAFARAGLTKVDPNLLSQCVGLASSLRLTPKKMAECWEAFSLNRNVNTLDEHSFTSYRQSLVKESEINAEPVGAVTLSKRGALPSVTPPAKRAHTPSHHTPSALDAVFSGRRVSLTPAPPQLSQTSNSNLPKYGDRQNAGKVVTTFNPRNLESLAVKEHRRRCTVSYDFDTNVSKPYRHMFTTLEERANALERQLVEMEDELIQTLGLDTEGEMGLAPLEQVGVPRQEKITCIGRVCNAAHEGRLNATSVLLEGSRHKSGGQRVELDLSYLKENKIPFSLFPGQIIAVEGLNTSGRKMVAHSICEGVAPKPAKSTVEELWKFHHHDSYQDGAPLRIMSVCGPYTASNDLEYEPLVDLANVVQVEKPDVVILAGPFVDMRHNIIRSGQTTLTFQDGEETVVSYEAFFANKVAGLLEDLFSAEEELHTQFVLAPSLDDATAEWVFPQPPLCDHVPGGKDSKMPGAEGIEVGTLGLHHIETAGHGQGAKRVHLVPNPCTLKINEMVVGLISNDVLFHISSDETNANLEPGSRLSRISQHLLQQRSYYPLFPAPTGVNLNFKFMNQWKMRSQPDILIIPSKLTSFTRAVQSGTVVVNPGQLTRDTTGGTYAIMDIHPLRRETLENAGGTDVELQHAVSERMMVEVKRI